MPGPWDTRQMGVSRIQAGVPMRPRARHTKANGLLLRGAVVATYVLDDPGSPELALGSSIPPAAVYCDVLTYSNLMQQRWAFIPKCLVSQSRGGLHRDDVWKPRATTLDITQGSFDINRAANPANLDGDHVLIGFMDDNLNTPVIIRGIPHPNADVGNEDQIAGHRVRLRLADGDPEFQKHHGTFYGIDSNGDFIVDTTRANDGSLDGEGKEPGPLNDGSVGNIRIRMQELTQCILSMTGRSEQGVAVAERLDALWTSLESYLNGHGHSATGGVPALTAPPAGGPVTGTTGTPLVASTGAPTSAPSFDPRIVSDKLRIPDTEP